MGKISKFSLIILMEMSECWEALFLSKLSMSFFMSSVLTSETRNFTLWFQAKVRDSQSSNMLSFQGFLPPGLPPGFYPGSASAPRPPADFFTPPFYKRNLEHQNGVMTKCLEKALHCSSVFIVNSEQIPRIFSVPLLLILNNLHTMF